MRTLSRLASYGEASFGVIGAAVFWLLDAAIEKYLVGSEQSFYDILVCPGTHEFRIRLLGTLLILLLVSIATLLLRRKEDSEARLQHGRFLLEEMTVELSHKNERLQAEIIRRKLVEQKLEDMAGTDQLTGIYNRRKFDELLNLALREEVRYPRGLCLMMLDIDHFKAVNDRLGHAVGDAVLEELAQLIEGTRREADSFFRIGGEEFALITFASNGANLETACEKVRKLVSQNVFDSAGHLTISVGATHYQADDSFDTIYRRADAALYKAKESGRDQVVIG